MAIKKPLVISDGQVEQLQEGDVIEQVALLPVTSIFGAGPAGQIVKWHSTGSSPGVDLARADAEATAMAIGIFSDVSNSLMQSEGVIELAAADWDTVTGQLGGLTPGATYYLSPTVAGRPTTTVPTADGHFVIEIGTAVNESKMVLRISTPIGL